MVKKCIIQDQYDLTDFILLARYHSKTPSDPRYAFCSYSSIAKLLRLSVESVRKVCIRYFRLRAEINNHVIVKSKRINKVGLRLMDCFELISG